MKTPLLSSSINLIVIFLMTTTIRPHPATGLGLSSSIAISYTSTSPTVCAIIAGYPHQSIQCYNKLNDKTISVRPQAPFDTISGGQGFFCGLHSGGLVLHCWNTTDFRAKRIYTSHTNSNRLTDLTVGDSQICAIEGATAAASCWRFPSPEINRKFRTITCGGGFACGILEKNGRVKCWGGADASARMEALFGNITMLSVVAGESHACGLSRDGIVICRGRRNEGGQLDVPSHSPFEFRSTLALGRNHSCGIRRRNGTVVCWGGGGSATRSSQSIRGVDHVSFESIAAGLDFTCGLTTYNLSIICWGPGWNPHNPDSGEVIPFGVVIPGPCTASSASNCVNCGVYPGSGSLCSGSGTICRPCDQAELPIPALLPPPPQPPMRARRRAAASLIYCIVGSVGAFAGICCIVYCLFSCRKIHDTVMEPGNDPSNVDVETRSRSSSIKRSDLWRQKSGASSKCTERSEEFSLSELASATDGFSPENKIGGGSFGTVYRGKLYDGRQVAIKRWDNHNNSNNNNTNNNMEFLEKGSAFDSELALLPRLHHKHLVELIGFCRENNECLLVYDYMSNGSLYNRLHSDSDADNLVLSCWRMRIRIALDAARGIEYLHNYAVPPIIHRDIKSSNILLDSNWTARVSDFGLSLMGPGDFPESISSKAVGTVGYIDPEYFVLRILTAKSDVYGFGVVLLELLTGKKAVFKNDGSGPIGLAEFARSRISSGDQVTSTVDERVGFSEGTNEVEAVKLVAYTALQCVSLEGKERPDMAEIVANLESAMALCEVTTSHGITS